jgi:ANTAR domain
MVEPIPTQAGPEPERREPTTDVPSVHVASGEDETNAKRQGDLFDAILARGDLRDQAAERRDRRADGRAPTSGDSEAGLDRIWSGRDRDSAAIDRAALVELLLHAQQEKGRTPQSVIDEAKDILIARNGCTRNAAFLDLRAAAARNELTIDELAECLVADQDLR